MNRERFLEILEAYGARADRWPEAERDAAIAFADAHAELVADALAVEAELDALLGEPEIPPSDMLEARIMKSLPKPQPTLHRWRGAVAIAAAVMLVVSISLGSGMIGSTGYVEDDLYYDDFAGLEDDWVDWLGDEDEL